jgi:hypothetical protein
MYFIQCDQIGQNFAIGANFLALGAFFSEKYRQMIWAQFVLFVKYSPKFT